MQPPAARAKAESIHLPPSEPTRALSAKIAPGQATTITRCVEPIPGQRQHSPPKSSKGQAPVFVTDTPATAAS